MAKNDCESATEAVKNDVKNSKKSYKQIGSELRRDLPVLEAEKRLTNKLLNDSTTKLFADEAVSICQIAGEASTYLNFIFSSLKDILKQEEATNFLRDVIHTYVYRMSHDAIENLLTGLSKEFGYLAPVKSNSKLEELEKEKIETLNVLNEKVEKLSKRTDELERGRKLKVM
jgi:hypothetical protein